MNSILQEDKVCYITGTTLNLEKHHIMFGSGRRKLSEKYGLWVWLRGDYHNKSNHGVHFNRKLDLFLKSEAQHRFIVVYPELDWLNIFGRNYLDR